MVELHRGGFATNGATPSNLNRNALYISHTNFCLTNSPPRLGLNEGSITEIFKAKRITYKLTIPLQNKEYILYILGIVHFTTYNILVC